jgi:hypothetical protein
MPDNEKASGSDDDEGEEEAEEAGEWEFILFES